MSPSRLTALAGAALVSTGLGLVAVSAPAQADTTVSKTVAYTCAGQATFPGGEPFDLGEYPVGVTVDFTVPTLTQGGTVPATPVSVKLTLAEDLHRAAVNFIHGTTVTGSSKDAELEVRANGQSTNYPISGLSVTDQPIEQDVEKPFIIPINGSSPEIAVPTADSIDLLAPKTFTVESTIFSPQDLAADPQSVDMYVDVDLACRADSDTDRLLSTVTAQAAPTPDPTDDPTPDPTDDPTTDPTDDPTDDPTVAPTDGTANDGGALNGGVQPISTRAASNDALPNTGAPEQLGAIAALGGALLLGGMVLARRRRSAIARTEL